MGKKVQNILEKELQLQRNSANQLALTDKHPWPSEREDDVDGPSIRAVRPGLPSGPSVWAVRPGGPSGPFCGPLGWPFEISCHLRFHVI